jgi:hypothetical protein
MLSEQQEALRRAAHLRSALEHLQAAAPPHAVGSDAGGRVQVVLGPDGLPVEIGAPGGWNGPAAAFGAAVEDAFAAASAQRLQTWSAAGSANGPEPPGPEEPAPVGTGSARPVEQIAEDVIAALGEAVALGTAPPAEHRGVGSAGAGRLVLLLSYRTGVRCSADPDWVSRLDAAGVNAALAVALRDARTALVSSATATARPWDGMLAEARSALADLSDRG